jgi:hypothetical protein
VHQKRACGIFDELVRNHKVESTNTCKRESGGALHTPTWDGVDFADSLVAGIAVGAGSVASVTASRDDPHWTGELLRACELVLSQLSRDDSKGHARTARMFAAALSRARTLLKTRHDLTPECTLVTGEHPELAGSLKRREEIWESRISP